MKPEENAKKLLAVTRSKAKMYEYNLPEEDHIEISYSLTTMLDLTLGILGDISADFETVKMDTETESFLFSAKYFDALLGSKTFNHDGGYLKLLGACSYYLNGYPGSAKVLVNQIKNIDLEANDLEKVIIALLKKTEISLENIVSDNRYKEIISDLNTYFNSFNINGADYELLEKTAFNLKKATYADGSDRELLLGDIVYAICLKIGETSVWKSLPKYSGIDVKFWRPYIQRTNAIKELWPAQILIGRKGLLKGNSAVIEIPTSAGKTKATELIIRSSILSGRSNLSIIVAPFRALCQEIYNNMSEQFKHDEDVYLNLVSDVMQLDLETEVDVSNQILILTPEKLEFLLRHDPEIADNISLITYDEGHLFDDASRGAKYELLLSSLKQKLSENTQVILISAVMPNSEEIGRWLIGPDCISVQARSLIPTQRSVAFTSWRDIRGRLEFVNESNVDEIDFFVPRVLESQELALKRHERKRRFFPKKVDNIYSPYHVALALGCRLTPSGSIGIFSGRKDSALVLAREIVDAFERGLDLQKPSDSADRAELRRIITYIQRTLGEDSPQANAAKIGILIHHGSTPHGLRLSVEHALKEQHAKFVICTSTLSQGVNLPIRYLIVTTDRQGKNKIKTRDFHNLMGRVGRAGIFTEGTIIFANHEIYDGKSTSRSQWRWEDAKELLDPSNSESCKSHILTLFDDKPEEDELIAEWEKNQEDIKSEIDGYLLNTLADTSDLEEIDELVTELVKNSLAYYQANDLERQKLIEIFLSHAREIVTEEPTVEKRKIFAKSVLNLSDSKEIFQAVENISDDLSRSANTEQCLELLWPIIFRYTKKLHNKKLYDTISEESLLTACKLWILGRGFPEILELLSNEKFGNRNANIDLIIDLCETGFGFNGSLVVSACNELMEFIDSQDTSTLKQLYLLQKRLKYGLPTRIPIILYEMGFSDRNLAIEIASIIKPHSTHSEGITIDLKENEDNIKSHLKSYYPAYFENKFQEMIR